jgi:hypothetical protein
MKKVVHWWVAPIIFLLIINSLFWSSMGALDDAVALSEQNQWLFLGGTAIVNIAGVALGMIGSERWHNDQKLAGAVVFLIGICVALVTFSYTQGAIEKTFAKNQNAAVTETATVENNADAIPDAQARVERANASLAPLLAAADTARAEFERESRSGFGPRATQRKSEWDAALAQVQAGQAELTAAEEELREARKEATPEKRSDAAIAADTTEQWEIWVRSWVFPALIELLPIMSGWLFFGYARDEQDDRLALLLDKVGAMEVRTSTTTRHAFSEPLPSAYHPKGNGETTGTAQEVWEQTADPEPDGDDTPEKRVNVSDERRKLMPPKRSDLKLVAGE